MHIEFLVEEPSAEAALHNLAPAILGPAVTFQVHPYNGKPDLLAKLPDRLRGYRPWLPADWRIVVLLDADEADCRQLKARLETIAHAAGAESFAQLSGFPQRIARHDRMNTSTMLHLAVIASYPCRGQHAPRQRQSLRGR